MKNQVSCYTYPMRHLIVSCTLCIGSAGTVLTTTLKEYMDVLLCFPSRKRQRTRCQNSDLLLMA